MSEAAAPRASLATVDFKRANVTRELALRRISPFAPAATAAVKGRAEPVAIFAIE